MKTRLAASLAVAALALAGAGTAQAAQVSGQHIIKVPLRSVAHIRPGDDSPL